MSGTMQQRTIDLDTGLALDVVRDETRFRRLEAEWRDLERRSPGSGVFQGFRWSSGMWPHERASGAQLRIAAVRSAGGGLVAVLPLVLERRSGLAPVRVLRFLGQPFADVQDICIEKGADASAVVALLGSWLGNACEDCDVVDLAELPSHSLLLGSRELLLEGFEARSVHVVPACERRLVPLPRRFDEYLEGLGRHFRKNQRRRRRLLAERFDLCFEVEDGFADPARAIADLMQLHQRRMRALGQRGLFRSEARCEAFAELFHALLVEGTLRIHRLLVDGRAVAADAVLSDGARATCYIGGMDPDPALAHFSLGTLNLLEAIRWSIETGHTECDLARGDEPYKLEYGAEALESVRLLGVRGRIRGSLSLAREFVWQRMARSTALRSAYRRALSLAPGAGSKP